ncbi:LysR family transcriptional regulator [Vibrio cholerae]|nr:LysR family transcriptional regulator [Vibrio cholerae]
MNIDIKQLKYFVAVAEAGNIGQAAKSLHLTQPPLSRQIGLLENELSTPLFLRHPKGVTLTPAGERFYKDAKQILASMSDAYNNVQNIIQGKAGELSIGFMMHAAYNIIPQLTKKYLAQYPDVALHLQEVIPTELIKLIKSAKFDAAVMLKTECDASLNSLKLKEEKLCLAVPTAHPLATTDIISGALLSQESFIATPMSVAPQLRNALDDYASKFNFEPKVILETQLQQTIVNMVSEELGIALVPEPLKKVQIPNVTFRDLPDAPSVEYVIVWRKDSLNPALMRLIENLKS